MKQIIKVDEEINLIPYYENYETTLKWYSSKDVCKKCDNIDEVYDLDRLMRMYNYLNTHGDLFYIEYQGVLVGDVSLQDDGTVGIAICDEYQNKHIGRRVIKQILILAREKKYPYVFAEIYSFNKQSEKMFLKCGFKKEDEEKYYYRFDFENLIDFVKDYSLSSLIIEASLLVGSYARGQQKNDSDVDIVILTTNKEELLCNGFFNKFDDVISYKIEQYGLCTSIRAFYKCNLEVEFGIVDLSWINKPLDDGTKKVLQDGYKIIIDKRKLFADLF